MKIIMTDLVCKLVAFVIRPAITRTFFIKLFDKIAKLQIPCYTIQNKRQEIKSVLIDKNSRFLGISDGFCNYKTLEFFSFDYGTFFYQCKHCKRIFERIK